jgi:hypothetical protein
MKNEQTAKQIQNNFTYHAPKDDQPERYNRIRGLGAALADAINESCPDSREKSLALTNLEQAIMWANAAIARNE